VNVLLIVFDDLVPLLSEYARPVTPHMDRLRERGMTFRRAHTPCAICAPGRACLFTGLRPDTHGVRTLGNKLRGKLPDLVTWPQALGSRGWHTMRSGKVYHKGVPECNAGGAGDDDPYSWTEARNPTGLDLNCSGLRCNYTPRDTHVVGSGGGTAECLWSRRMCGRVFESVPAIYADKAFILSEDACLYAFASWCAGGQ
jgi:hypothetical protein